jgi:hypothetical protein
MSKSTRRARAEVPEEWRGFLPETQHVLLAVLDAGGLALACQVALSLQAEVDLSKQRRASELTELLVTVMEGGESLGYPVLQVEGIELAPGLEAWAAMTAKASVEQLRLLREAIGLRQQSIDGRKRLANLSATPRVKLGGMSHVEGCPDADQLPVPLFHGKSGTGGVRWEAKSRTLGWHFQSQALQFYC